MLVEHSINIRTDWKPYPFLPVLMSNSLVSAVLCHAFCLNKKCLFRDTSSCLLFVYLAVPSQAPCASLFHRCHCRANQRRRTHPTWSRYNYATNANSTPTVTNRKGLSLCFFEKENLNHTLHQSVNNEKRVSNTCSQFTQPRSEPKPVS